MPNSGNSPPRETIPGAYLFDSGVGVGFWRLVRVIKKKKYLGGVGQRAEVKPGLLRGGQIQEGRGWSNRRGAPLEPIGSIEEGLGCSKPKGGHADQTKRIEV